VLNTFLNVLQELQVMEWVHRFLEHLNLHLQVLHQLVLEHLYKNKNWLMID